MLKPVHVREIIARTTMVLKRLEQRRVEEMEAAHRITGRLSDLNLFDLIETFGVERKTGVLNLINANNRRGQVFFQKGSVINASLDRFRAEGAIYQMLAWRAGEFAMVFKNVEVPDEMSVSNLGLLLQGMKRLEQREKLLAQLPSPRAVFVPTENFKKVLEKKQMTTDASYFVSLFDGRRDLDRIIDESPYDDLMTLERTAKLYQQGFIEVVTPVAVPEAARAEEVPRREEEIMIEAPPPLPTPPLAEVAEALPPPEVEAVIPPLEDFGALRAGLFEPRGVTQGSLVLIGASGSGREEIIQHLTAGNYQARTLEPISSQPVELGTLPLPSPYKLAVIGLSMEKQFFTPVLKAISQGMLGYVFIIDSTRSPAWDYERYLLNTLRAQFSLPFVVAITRLGELGAAPIERIREQVGLGEDVPWMIYDLSTAESASELLRQLTSPIGTEKGAGSRASVKPSGPKKAQLSELSVEPSAVS